MITETAKGVGRKAHGKRLLKSRKKGSPGMSGGGKKCLVGVKCFKGSAFWVLGSKVPAVGLRAMAGQAGFPASPTAVAKLLRCSYRGQEAMAVKKLRRGTQVSAVAG